MRIALGLDLFLEEFAAEHDALTFRDWGGGEHWKRRLQVVASDPGTEIFFNLTEVDVYEGLLRGAQNKGGGTDWELTQFKGNEDWLQRCTWYRDGEVAPQPEELS